MKYYYFKSLDMTFDADELKALSLTDIDKLFVKASTYSVTDKFADEFWRVMSEVASTDDLFSQKDVLQYLEDYKRHLGRLYDKTKSYNVAIRYNNVEGAIRHLCATNCLERSSKPYFLTKIGE